MPKGSANSANVFEFLYMPSQSLRSALFFRFRLNYEFSWQTPLWELHGIHQTESRLQIVSIGGGCISRWFTVCCLILLRKMNCFCPWDFVFRTALSGLRAEICIESKWVCSHIKLSYDLEQNVMDAKTQFDMAVNPFWFNINLKTSAKTWREHCGSSLLECTFLWVLFLWIILTKLRWIRARGRGL